MYLIQAGLQICVLNININFFQAHSDSGTEYKNQKCVFCWIWPGWQKFP